MIIEMNAAAAADEIARTGIRENRAIIVSDSRRREMFENGIVHLVLSAFDGAKQFYRRRFA
jgi:hypothetical protein